MLKGMKVAHKMKQWDILNKKNNITFEMYICIYSAVHSTFWHKNYYFFKFAYLCNCFVSLRNCIIMLQQKVFQVFLFPFAKATKH